MRDGRTIARLPGVTAGFIDPNLFSRLDRNDDRVPIPAADAWRNLSRFDAFWSANYIGYWNPAVHAQLRMDRPACLECRYVSGITTKSGTASFLPRDAVRPEWLLQRDHNRPAGPDNAIEWPGEPDRVFLNVADGRCAAWAADHLVRLASGEIEGTWPSHSGLAIDNAWMGQHGTDRFATLAPDWQYAGREEAWDQAVLSYLSRIVQLAHRRSIKVIVNNHLEYGPGGDAALWRFLLDACRDGLLTERAITFDKQEYSEEVWRSALDRHDEVAERGIDWWWVDPWRPKRAAVPDHWRNDPVFWQQREHDRDFLFHLCSWLLTYVPGRSLWYANRYRAQVEAASDEEWYKWPDPWWYTYHVPIGDPLGARYHDGRQWHRNFTGGIVSVDPSWSGRRGSLLLKGR